MLYRVMLPACLFLVFGSPNVYATWCWIQGEVYTTNNSAGPVPVPCKHMIVYIWDGSDIIGETTCDAAGHFGVSVPIGSSADLHIQAVFKGWLPGGGATYIIPEGSVSFADLMTEDWLWSDSLHCSFWQNYSVSTLSVGRMYLGRNGGRLGTEPKIVAAVVDAMWYIHDNCAWDAVNIIVFPNPQPPKNPVTSAWYDGYVHIGTGYYDSTADDLGCVVHEVSHLVHHRATGVWTPGPAVDPHYNYTVANFGHALTEGWAEYSVNAIIGSPLPAGSAWRDTAGQPYAPVLWRGGSGGTGSGFQHSGQNVEGAVTVTLQRHTQLHNDYVGWFNALKNGKPKTFKEWLDRYCYEHSAWAPKQDAFNIAQENGMVYGRGRVVIGEQNALIGRTPALGNAEKVSGVNNVLCIRGTIQSQAQSLHDADLWIAVYGQTIVASPTNYLLGCKAARTNLGGTPPDLSEAFGPSWSWTGMVPWGAYTMDTKAFPGNDGDYDLIMSVQHSGGIWDTLMPRWSAWGGQPANPAPYDTDERFLKHQVKTWFSQDQTINTDEKGMVRVDNTAPTIQNCKPAANP